MKATFENTVDILVKAYLNDTLLHDYCTACAVGNIVSHSFGYSPMNILQGWPTVFYTDRSCGQKVKQKNYNGLAKQQIDSTGYSVEQLARIEFAFETADYGKNGETWMFNGLMAVVDVLADIHGISLEQKTEAKAMFVKENI